MSTTITTQAVGIALQNDTVRKYSGLFAPLNPTSPVNWGVLIVLIILIYFIGSIISPSSSITDQIITLVVVSVLLYYPISYVVWMFILNWLTIKQEPKIESIAAPTINEVSKNPFA